MDVWRTVPTVNDVALTGPDDGASRGPAARTATGGYQLDARVGDAAGAGARCADQSRADSGRAAAAAARRPVLVPAGAVHEPSCARACRRGRAGTTPLPDPDPPLNELEQQGKAVFMRACAQCHGGPGQSTPAGAGRFGSTPSRASVRVPVDTVTPARFAFAPCPPRLARNARTYEIALSVPTPGPAGLLPPGPRCAARAPIPAARC